MRPSYSTTLLIIAVIFSLVFGMQSCDKKQNTPTPTPTPTIPNNPTTYIRSGFSTSSAKCYLYTDDPISFIPSPYDSIPAGSTFLWKFGDGTTSTIENPQHIYSSVGSFVVTLTINNDTPHASSKTIRLYHYYAGSQYTALMGGLRMWHGRADHFIIEWGMWANWLAIDSMFAVQIIDSGTIEFLDHLNLYLRTIDTTQNVLYFTNCNDRTLAYYYAIDSIMYWNSSNGPGHEGEQLSLHSP